MSTKPVILIALSILTFSALLNMYQFMTVDFLSSESPGRRHDATTRVASVSLSSRGGRHRDSWTTDDTGSNSRHEQPPLTKSSPPNRTIASPSEATETTTTTSSFSSLSLSAKQEPHRVAGLLCPKPPVVRNDEHDNNKNMQLILDPSLFQQAQEELVYWQDIPHDSLVSSPYRALQKDPEKSTTTKKKKKFLTFEPDEGGWNNIRLAMETAASMAIVMGRTLVLPPQHVIYLLWEQEQQQPPQQQANGSTAFNESTSKKKIDQRSSWNFDDFFHLESIQQEMTGGALEILTFQEFLEQYVMTGKAFDDQKEVPLPPDNRTDWNGEIVNWEATKTGGGARLWSWWRQVSQPLDWKYGECVAVFPQPTSSGENDHDDDGWVYTTKEDEDRFRSYMTEIEARDQLMAKKRYPKHEIPPRPAWVVRLESYNGRPTPVNASTVDRLAEMLADRSELCIYDRTLQQAPVLHVKGEQQDTRFLVPFYAMLFVEDWHYDLWLKRFVRDHLRYLDIIQCAAARVVAAVHQAARTKDNPNGSFDSMHIRRGDFQYEHMKLSAEDLYDLNLRTMFRENRTVFVATDEKNRTFFEALENHYHVYYLSDFLDLLPDVNPNYYGMIDQLVAAVGETFIGTYYSTFTGLINRVRGYHAQKHKLYGYEHGRIDSYYYAGKDMAAIRNIMRGYRAIRQGFWMQEFPVSWRDLDHDVVNSTIVEVPHDPTISKRPKEAKTLVNKL